MLSWSWLREGSWRLKMLSHHYLGLFIPRRIRPFFLLYMYIFGFGFLIDRRADTGMRHRASGTKATLPHVNHLLILAGQMGGLRCHGAMAGFLREPFQGDKDG